MYLISAYFDERSENTLQKLIDLIAESTGNRFMTENKVPPHLTLCALETKSPDELASRLKEISKNMRGGEVPIVAVGEFFPYVIFASPLMNRYLNEISKTVLDCVKKIPEVSVNRFYTTGNWFPHITLGKTLSKEELRLAFSEMQNSFVPFDAKITEIAVSATNPHRDIFRTRIPPKTH